VESSGYPESCFDPVRRTMTDDCSYGTSVLNDLLDRFGMADHWCYRDEGGTHHGADRRRIDEVFATADLLLDMGRYKSWLSEVDAPGLRVFLDGEPGSTQMRMAKESATG